MSTYNPALEKITKMGYKIELVDNEESFDWQAIKGDDVFIASDPLRLLGLISSKEEYEANHIPNHYDNILKYYYDE